MKNHINVKKTKLVTCEKKSIVYLSTTVTKKAFTFTNENDARTFAIKVARNDKYRRDLAAKIMG